MKRLGIILLLLIADCWLLIAEVLACPGCSEALFDPAQAEQAVRTARGFAWSIYTLLAVPVLLVAGIATLIVRASRRVRR